MKFSMDVIVDSINSVDVVVSVSGSFVKKVDIEEVVVSKYSVTVE